MISIKDLTIEDRALFEKYYNLSKYENSEANFTNMFMWKESYNIKYIVENNFLTLCASHPSIGHYHHVPAGEGDILEMLRQLRDCHMERYGSYSIRPVTLRTKEMIEQALPGAFDFEEKRDYEDYIYSVEELIALPGKKYHAKKNHYNSFVKNYSYTYQPITPDTATACCEAVCRWVETRSEDPEGEKRAVRNIFENYEMLSVTGAFLTVGNQIVAVTVGEDHHGTALIHIEKADTDYKGVYVAINKLFLENAFSHCMYVNREEDMGIEGLRKAKLSYQPVKLLEKYVAYPR